MQINANFVEEEKLNVQIIGASSLFIDDQTPDT